MVHEWGINHIDTAAGYGASEDRLKPWLADHRDEVFLATKTGERTGAGARAELERSLERMGVDHVDLIQLHNLVEPDEWEVAVGPGGAFEALFAARDEGLARNVGVTGHGLRIAGMHLRALERYDVASVLLPVNFVLLDRPDYRADVERLLERVHRTRRSRSRRSRRSPRGAGRRNRPPLQLVRAVDRPGRDRPCRALRVVGPAAVPQHDERRPPAPADHRRRHAATSTGPTDAELRADVAAYGITPLFDNDNPRTDLTCTRGA